jgi:hypothetical protein
MTGVEQESMMHLALSIRRQNPCWGLGVAETPCQCHCQAASPLDPAVDLETGWAGSCAMLHVDLQHAQLDAPNVNTSPILLHARPGFAEAHYTARRLF